MSKAKKVDESKTTAPAILDREAGRIVGLTLDKATKGPPPTPNAEAPDAYVIELQLHLGDGIGSVPSGPTFREFADSIAVIDLPEEKANDDEGKSRAGGQFASRAKFATWQWVITSPRGTLCDAMAQCRLAPKIRLDGRRQVVVVVDLLMTVDEASYLALSRHKDADVTVSAHGAVQLGIDFEPDEAVQ